MRNKGRIFTRYCTTVIGLIYINANRKRLSGLKGMILPKAANDNFVVAANKNIPYGATAAAAA